MCSLGQLLLLPGPLCMAQPLPLTAYLPTPGWGVSLPTSTGVLSVHILLGPIQKGAAQGRALSAPISLHDLLRVPRGNGASNLAWEKKKKYRSIKPEEGIEEPQMKEVILKR